MALRQTLLVVVLGMAAFTWISLPPDRVAFDEACEPVDLQAQLSATLHGERFWRTQQAAAATMTGQLLALPAATAHANDAAKSSMNAIEQRMTRLSMPPGGEDERQLAAEQRERIEKIAWLTRCHDTIAHRAP